MNVTPASIAVLKLLARSPDQKYYVREIASITGVSVGGCHKILGNLSAMGLIGRESRGRNLYYTIVMTNPAVTHLKIFLNIQDLYGVLKSVRDRCSRIVMFGSCSTGEDTLESDIDLLVITESTDKVHRLILKSWKGSRRLHPVMMRPVEYITLKDSDRALYDEIRKGIILWREGDE